MTSYEINTLRSIAKTLLKIVKRYELRREPEIDLSQLEQLTLAEVGLGGSIRGRNRSARFVLARRLFLITCRRRYGLASRRLASYLNMTHGNVNSELRNASALMSDGKFFTHFNHLNYAINHGRPAKSTIQKTNNESVSNDECTISTGSNRGGTGER